MSDCLWPCLFAFLLPTAFWTQTYVEIDRTLTWANYQEAFTDPLVRHLMIRSVAIAGAVTLATVCLAYPIAYFIAFRTQKKTLWLSADHHPILEQLPAARV